MLYLVVRMCGVITFCGGVLIVVFLVKLRRFIFRVLVFQGWGGFVVGLVLVGYVWNYEFCCTVVRGLLVVDFVGLYK